MEGRLEQWKSFGKNEKIKQSHSAEKRLVEKILGMAFYLVLDAVDALKKKN